MVNEDFVGMKRSRIWLASVCEPLIRLGGALAEIMGRDANATEMSLRGRVIGGSRGWRIGRRVRFVGPAQRFRLGDRVCLYGDTYLDANGASGFVSIGERSHVDVGSILYGQGGLSIGGLCAIAAGTIIYSQSNADRLRDGTPVVDQPTEYRAVHIGAGCWLGAGTRILPGVRIGDGVHVGAGAVVNRDVETETIVAGVPARPIGMRR